MRNVRDMTRDQIAAERRELAARGREILDRGQRERRALTSDEEQRWSETHDRLRELDLESRRREIDGEPGDRSQSRGVRAGGQMANPFDDSGSAGAGAVEVRALGPNESAREYLQSRGALQGQEELRGLTLGRFLRALAVGAQSDLERRALSGSVDASGGVTVPDILGAELIDLMRARSVTLRAGARMVVLESDQHSFARVASDPTPLWRSENEELDEREPTFEAVTFTPRSLAYGATASVELLQDSINLEQQLPALLAAPLAVEIDRAALVGSGTAPEPLGISGTTGVNAVAVGGALTSYDDFVDGAKLILDDNGLLPTVAVMAPREWATVEKFADTTGQPLQRPPSLANLRFEPTTSIPTTEGGGTESRIILGGFEHLWIGVRSQIRVEILRERYMDKLQIGFVPWARYDFNLAQPKAFAQLTGVTP